MLLSRREERRGYFFKRWEKYFNHSC